ncbi:MAG: DUF58 domain-containing protein [Nitrospirae bacterium]|nr:DUF58 domain-containing protein [Nitrospirota bacterium]
MKVTSVGIRYLLLCLAVGLAAVNTGNNLLYLLFAMMLSLILVSGILSERTLRRLSATRDLPPRLFAGSPISSRITLTNAKRFMPAFSLRVRERVGAIRVTAPDLWCPRLDPGCRMDFDTTITFHDRGLHRLKGVEVTTAFPFGLFEKTFLLPAETQSLVYPPIEAMPPLAARGESDNGVRTVGRGTTGLHQLRDYHPGDDPRYIHWKHSARRAKLVVREPEREVSRTFVLVFSNRLPADPLPIHREWFEDAVRLTASLASQAIHDGYEVLLATWDGASRSANGRLHLERLLRTLATIDVSTPSPGDRLISWTLAIPNPTPHLILVWDDPAWARIRPRCQRVWVMAQRAQPEEAAS